MYGGTTGPRDTLISSQLLTGWSSDIFTSLPFTSTMPVKTVSSPPRENVRVKEVKERRREERTREKRVWEWLQHYQEQEQELRKQDVRAQGMQARHSLMPMCLTVWVTNRPTEQMAPMDPSTPSALMHCSCTTKLAAEAVQDVDIMPNTPPALRVHYAGANA
ncbi:hypothetical protein BKA93DRAFT_748214 [Sparassis latifolia]